ncbi:hypothetical protein CPB84DRAFT_1813712 [Gymnopilus junonius]|uniref:Flavin reductase like domain-containing protein n=1 Tax=Gymnopilus junonius TaxID=109634 RepID=A0A9P5TRI0_GYMJU|nr:hypothetical protein CPB84DRAFT_1813712 [Gymnopilus junonius]
MAFDFDFKYTASPNPGWTYGQGIEATPEGRAWAEGESAGWTVIETAKEEPGRIYSVTHSPPLISFACSHNSGAAKDTVRNVHAGTGFTVNIISEPWVEHSNIASTNAPFEVHVKAPRVKESAFSMECELYQAVEIRDPKTDIITSTLVLGLVKFIHIRNDVIDERGVADPGKLKPIARMGGLTYAKVSEGFTLPRRPWKDISEELKEKLKDEVDI